MTETITANFPNTGIPASGSFPVSHACTRHIRLLPLSDLCCVVYASACILRPGRRGAKLLGYERKQIIER